MAVQLTVPGKGERAVGRSGWFSGPWSRQEDSLGKSRDTYRVLTSDLTSDKSCTENRPGEETPGPGNHEGPSLGGGSAVESSRCFWR